MKNSSGEGGLLTGIMNVYVVLYTVNAGIVR